MATFWCYVDNRAPFGFLAIFLSTAISIFGNWLRGPAKFAALQCLSPQPAEPPPPPPTPFSGEISNPCDCVSYPMYRPQLQKMHLYLSAQLASHPLARPVHPLCDSPLLLRRVGPAIPHLAVTHFVRGTADQQENQTNDKQIGPSLAVRIFIEHVQVDNG